jgi:SAM-dependent methyltransferase
MKKDFARQYGDLEQWHWWFRGRRRIIESVLRRELPLPSSRRILSVGCGPVRGLKWLKPFAGEFGQVVGLDVDFLHARLLPADLAFVGGDVKSLPFANGAFDMVLALDVLEHLDDDSAGLREVARVTKPGGLLLVTVPALQSLWGSQDLISEHRRRYTKGSLAGLFNKAGLKGYRINYFNTLLFPAAFTMRLLRRAAGSAEHMRSDFEDNRPGLVNDLLAGVFSVERHLIDRVPMPVGVSLVAKYRPPV